MVASRDGMFCSQICLDAYWHWWEDREITPQSVALFDPAKTARFDIATDLSEQKLDTGRYVLAAEYNTLHERYRKVVDKED
jgi:hypothetical protein